MAFLFMWRYVLDADAKDVNAGFNQARNGVCAGRNVIIVMFVSEILGVLCSSVFLFSC